MTSLRSLDDQRRKEVEEDLRRKDEQAKHTYVPHVLARINGCCLFSHHADSVLSTLLQQRGQAEKGSRREGASGNRTGNCLNDESDLCRVGCGLVSVVSSLCGCLATAYDSALSVV